MVITTWEVIVVGGAISIHLSTGDIIGGSGCRYMLGYIYTHMHADYCSIHVHVPRKGIAYNGVEAYSNFSLAPDHKLRYGTMSCIDGFFIQCNKIN